MHGSRIKDIFEYNIITGLSTRITYNQMADDPLYHKNEKIVFVNDKVEGSALLMLDIKSGDIEEIEKEKWGRYFYAPSISPDKRVIALSVIENSGKRYIAVRGINAKSELQNITEGYDDSRNPIWIDNKNLLFISYEKDTYPK